MKKVAAILLLLSMLVAEAQPSYWFSQLQRKPDAKQSQEFWFVPGQNMFFTYATNRVILNSAGGGGGPWDPLGAAHDATNGFPWLVLSDPAGAAHNATNGFPWGVLYDAAGLAATKAHDATNGFPWGVLYDPAGAAHDATNNFTIPATKLIGFAPGTGVTFTTNTGVLSINSTGGGGAGLTTNFSVYFADGTLNSLVFSNGGLQAIVFQISPQVTSWNARVIANGGASTSTNTQLALTIFLHSLTNSGLNTKMLTMNAIVPDNLTAALTPLIVGSSTDPWGNHNFVSGDLTVNGLVGNGTTKYATTGVAGDVFVTSASAGFTVYYSSYVNEAAVELLSLDASAHQVGIYLYSGVIYFDCFNTTPSEISHALTAAGYVSGNRISSGSFDIYFANSGNAHSSLVHGTAAPGAMPTPQYYVWAGNNNGTPFLWTSKRLSFVAIHNGLTAAESLAFFNAIQALRTALGGGAV